MTLKSEQIDAIIYNLLKRVKCSEDSIVSVCNDIQMKLDAEPVLLELDSDIVVVGDLHGNFDSLLRIFENNGYPPAKRYLFLGDFVDRGDQSTEILVLLFSLKLKFPENVYMLRGNHEGRRISTAYGFAEECKSKYSSYLYDVFVETFYLLPLCAVVGEKVFCVHGGISPDLVLSSLKSKAKPDEVNESGLFADLLWSDPNPGVKLFRPSERGLGRLYGPKALRRFLKKNSLDVLIRSHECCSEGIDYPFKDNKKVGEKCLTVFSSPDYCEQNNKAAVVFIDKDMKITSTVFQKLADPSKRRVTFPVWLLDSFIKPTPRDNFDVMPTKAALDVY